MMGRVKLREILEVDLLVHTEAVARSPRGWGEAGVKSLEIEVEGRALKIVNGDQEYRLEHDQIEAICAFYQRHQ
jgi:hypothetical protein